MLKNDNFALYLSEQVKSRIKSGTLSGLKVHPINHVLFPKKNAYDFRRAALIQPVDTICYLALVLMYADTIEKYRINKGKKVVFSYRFKPNNGSLFDPRFTFSAFKSYTTKRIKETNIRVLVKCDISNYYDRLNLHRLESTLLSLSIDSKYIKLTNDLLLFWANRDSYGLPTGGNASRILAEAALISVDDYLTSLKVKFCRYVDDYRLFAPDAKTAHVWLTILVERLYLEGLTINPSKTVIEDVSKKFDATTYSEESKKVVSELGQSRIIVGYTGTIPTKFRRLSKKEVNELRGLATEEFETKITENEILQPVDVRKFLKIIVARGDYSKLKLYKPIVEKFPQFTPLLLDLLIKMESSISSELKKDIEKYFSKLLSKEGEYPEYMLISVIKLLGSSAYSNRDVLIGFFRSLKRNSGAYIGRAVLDALTKNVDRTNVLEIRQYYARADQWEKRAIIKIVNGVLSEEEKRPWLKNVKVHSADDYFAIELFDPKKARN